MRNFLDDAMEILRGEQFEELPQEFPSQELRILSRKVGSTPWWMVAAIHMEPGSNQGVVELGLQLHPRGEEYGTEFRFRRRELLRMYLRSVVAELDTCAASGKNLRCPECGRWMKRQKSKSGRPKNFVPFLGCEGYPDCKRKIQEGVIEVVDRWRPPS